ncbi:MAG: hypothetical protein L7H10_02590 [Vulcanisaeta sp.]|nr:hypothetical protein [Vulcanisaeta sp.]MCG2869621.1 hypothetical protein [Vulcanisaeta sp.]MCG2880796.1 hypothetical protein [Vulcanisaeta sp.]MCG2886839.1 hypothetical protein [Vulcanisaeta sp.]
MELETAIKNEAFITLKTSQYVGDYEGDYEVKIRRLRRLTRLRRFRSLGF